MNIQEFIIVRGWGEGESGWKGGRDVQLCVL